jgi:hypothetical protein
LRKKRGNKDELTLVLYNFKDGIVEGYIDLEKYKSDTEFMVNRSYAIEKHGPLMYDLALSILSPEGIIPDRTIRHAAQKVWNYFDKNRNDVKKTIITPGHEWYAEEYSIDAETDNVKEPEVLKMLNKIYSVDKPMPHMEELIARGNSLIASNHSNIKEVIDKAAKAFKQRYDSEF